MHLSMDCKATVSIGDYSRGGKTRGDDQATDHDMGCEERHAPFGVVNEDSDSLHLSFGSSAKPSDFIIDSPCAWWACQAPEEGAGVTHIQIKADSGPEGNGRRTQFVKLMIESADHIGTSIHLLYYPPYHSKCNPVQRCSGIPEKHWNVGKLADTQTRLGWLRFAIWTGVHPVFQLSRAAYQERRRRGQERPASCRVQAGKKPAPTQLGHRDPLGLHGMTIRSNHLNWCRL